MVQAGSLTTEIIQSQTHASIESNTPAEPPAKKYSPGSFIYLKGFTL